MTPTDRPQEGATWFARIGGILRAEPELYRLLDDLADTEDCWFDHDADCQAHGYLSLEPGEVCPVQIAKDLLGAADRGRQ